MTYPRPWNEQRVFVRVFSSYHVIPDGTRTNPANHEGGDKYWISSLRQLSFRVIRIQIGFGMVRYLAVYPLWIGKNAFNRSLWAEDLLNVI